MSALTCTPPPKQGDLRLKRTSATEGIGRRYSAKTVRLKICSEAVRWVFDRVEIGVVSKDYQSGSRSQLKLQYPDQDIVGGVRADGDAESAHHEYAREEESGNPAEDEVEPQER